MNWISKWRQLKLNRNEKNNMAILGVIPISCNRLMKNYSNFIKILNIFHQSINNTLKKYIIKIPKWEGTITMTKMVKK